MSIFTRKFDSMNDNEKMEFLQSQVKEERNRSIRKLLGNDLDDE